MKKSILFIISAIIIGITSYLVTKEYNIVNQDIGIGISYKMVNEKWVIDTLNTNEMYLDSAKAELDTFNGINAIETHRMYTFLQWKEMLDNNNYIPIDTLKNKLPVKYLTIMSTSNTISVLTLRSSWLGLVFERTNTYSFSEYFDVTTKDISFMLKDIARIIKINDDINSLDLQNQPLQY